MDVLEGKNNVFILFVSVVALKRMILYTVTAFVLVKQEGSYLHFQGSLS